MIDDFTKFQPFSSRFSGLDKENQNIVAHLLEQQEEKDDNVDHDDPDTVVPAVTKAKRFYKSCVTDSLEQDKENLMNLQVRREKRF